MAQFGVVFLLFALGLEFSMTKVGIRWLFDCNENENEYSCELYNLSLIIRCSCVDAAAESCWPSCCPWRTFPNRITDVSVWCDCIGMCKSIMYIGNLE